MNPIILAPVDFSHVSINAAQYAAQFAFHFHANLKLIHIVQLPVVYGEIPMPIGNYEHIVHERHVQMDALVQKLKQELGGELNVQYEIKTGSPLYEIADMAEKEKPLMLVIGTRGLGTMERFLLGSVTLSLTIESPVPVLVVPDNWKFKPVAKIGFATDLEQVVNNTPDNLIRKFTDMMDAELHIIHNDPNYHEYEPVYMQEGMLLDTMFARQKHRFHFLHSTFTEEVIISHAKKNNLDWLMVQPHKHGFFEEMFGHRHTREFVLYAEVPVMVLPLP
jgi:nucleotide-binding universal stress UspA family protein